MNTVTFINSHRCLVGFHSHFKALHSFLLLISRLITRKYSYTLISLGLCEEMVSYKIYHKLLQATHAGLKKLLSVSIRHRTYTLNSMAPKAAFLQACHQGTVGLHLTYKIQYAETLKSSNHYYRAVQWHYIDKLSNDTVPNHSLITTNHQALFIYNRTKIAG